MRAATPAGPTTPCGIKQSVGHRDRRRELTKLAGAPSSLVYRAHHRSRWRSRGQSRRVDQQNSYLTGTVPRRSVPCGIGLLGEGRHPFKVEKRVRNPYAVPFRGIGLLARIRSRRAWQVIASVGHWTSWRRSSRSQRGETGSKPVCPTKIGSDATRCGSGL